MTEIQKSSISGKLIYGLSFVVLLPGLLIAWAVATNPSVALPVPLTNPAGVVIAILGGWLMLTGMATLMHYGHGLPMNAYPPKKFVHQGIYRIVRHPIYAGFSLLCIGISIAADSGSGLWLVSPVVILGCFAIVLGFERPDLLERFGMPGPGTGVAFPADDDRSPRTGERIGVYLLVLGPWLVLYEGVSALGIPRGAISGYLAVENEWPVIEWTEIFYISAYFFVFLVPLTVRSSKILRQFSIAGLVATGVGIFIFIVIPVVALPKGFTAQTIPGQFLEWERMFDSPAAALPSFHVVWALLSASAYTRDGRRPRFVLWACAIVISASCLTTGMHSLLDVIAGWFVAWMALRSAELWEALRRFAERVANSWREWQLGPLRVINHGLYAGAGSFLGLALIGSLVGADLVWEIQFVALCSLLSAALWAQFVEGSSSLLRPFGYYGGVIGIAFGILLLEVLGIQTWSILAGFAVAGPFIQAIGRLRCLIQGCCHGKPAPAHIGICYTHPRSRVCRLTDLGGKPVHPTPLYSMLWNLIVGIFLLRLWFLDAPLPLIIGLYLILNGLGRFVEEAYRGEPQTPILGKLRLYQIMAITSVVSGIGLTMVRVSVVAPPPQWSGLAIGAAAAFGLVTWFAQGMDFPNSHRRFSRLA